VHFELVVLWIMNYNDELFCLTIDEYTLLGVSILHFKSLFSFCFIKTNTKYTII